MIDYTTNPHPWGLKPKQVLLNNLKHFKEGSVLDLGCGDGKDTLYLASSNFDVTAVDKNPKALEILKSSLSEMNLDNVNLILSDLSDFIARKETFDNIISFMTLHFLPKNVGYDAIAWIKNHTHEGGLNILYDFTNEGGLNVQNDSPNFWLKPGELKKLYKDWELFHYDEHLTNTRGGSKQMVAEIVARKMSN